MTATNRRDEDCRIVLEVVTMLPDKGPWRGGRGVRSIAESLGWYRPGEGPRRARIDRYRAQLALDRLARSGLVQCVTTGADTRYRPIDPQPEETSS